MKEVLIILALVIGGVGVLAFATRDDSPTETNGQSTQQSGQSEPTQAVEVSEEAPDFTLEGLNGEEIALADYKGEKPVILDFWASWCHNCQRDMPKLQAFYEEFDSQVEVIAINLQENKSTAKDFIEENGFTYPVALDPIGDAAVAYGIQYTNTHVLISREGQVVDSFSGDIERSHFEQLL